MTKSKSAEDGILTSVHRTTVDLAGAGVIDKATIRAFDVLCQTPIQPMSPDDIRALRKREHVSQPVFAHCLNVRKDAVSQ